MKPGAGGDPLERLFRDMQIAAAPPPVIPGYHLLEHAGTGGFGTVYRARDLQLERDVALKILHAPAGAGPEAEERFLREARALARVRHPNVVTLYGVIAQEGLRALSTEYIEGRPLEEVVRREGPFPAERVIAIGIDLCRALAAVHTAGIVHRDVKTTNVLVAESGRIVLADFGLGVHLERGQAGEHSAAGTPVFMAPEVLRGEPADARSDIYALGVVLYRLAAGRLPFEEGRIEELKARIARGEPAPLPAPRSTAEAGLRRVIERALSVDPGARFATAQEMEAALVAISPPFAAGAPPRSRLPALAAAAGIAVLVAWMIWQAWPGSAAKGEFRAGARPGPGAEIEVRADAEVHVYLLREDRRGRRYLLFPRDAEEAAAKLSAGRRLALGHSDPEALRNGARGSLVVLAARDPVLALVDSIPPKGTSAGTGKDGSPRLKPIAVRGLLRTLAQAGWIAEADQASGETEPVLRERLPLVPHSAPSRGGVWAARRALPEGTPEAGAGDDEDDEDDGRGR